jgi:hypothetical protein
MKVGQTLYGVGQKGSIEEYKITKAGRLYITINQWNTKYHKDTLEKKDWGYTLPRKLHITREEIEEQIEKHKTYREIADHFVKHHNPVLLMEQIRKIHEIIFTKP